MNAIWAVAAAVALCAFIFGANDCYKRDKTATEAVMKACLAAGHHPRDCRWAQ